MSISRTKNPHPLKGKVGADSPFFRGYYQTPFIESPFESRRAVSKFLGTESKTTSRIYKNPEKVVCSRAYSMSKMLQRLGNREEVVGKGYYDLGFASTPAS